MRTIAQQAFEGNLLVSIGAGEDLHVFDPPVLITGHYSPFNNPNLVGLTLAGHQHINSRLRTPVELAPPSYT